VTFMMMMMMMTCKRIFCFRVRMAGSIMLTMKTAAEAMTEKKQRHQWFFYCWSEQFDPEQCVSDQKFTVNPNEEHVLLIRSLPNMPVMFLDNAKQLQKNVQHGDYLFGFSISLKQPDMTLVVGEETKMSLLLNSGYFNVVPFFLTLKQFSALMHHQPKSEPDA
jgi:hypothetical protein